MYDSIHHGPTFGRPNDAERNLAFNGIMHVGTVDPKTLRGRSTQFQSGFCFFCFPRELSSDQSSVAMLPQLHYIRTTMSSIRARISTIARMNITVAASRNTNLAQTNLDIVICMDQAMNIKELIPRFDSYQALRVIDFKREWVLSVCMLPLSRWRNFWHYGTLSMPVCFCIRCEDTISCGVLASKDVFGGICDSKSSYLEVDYVCKDGVERGDGNHRTLSLIYLITAYSQLVW